MRKRETETFEDVMDFEVDDWVERSRTVGAPILESLRDFALMAIQAHFNGWEPIQVLRKFPNVRKAIVAQHIEYMGVECLGDARHNVRIEFAPEGWEPDPSWDDMIDNM